ncbi:hypothetical protein [Thioflexithrix psekupsensis]|nr:hypothetical protein [Thioflexithrix psekupsensis]
MNPINAVRVVILGGVLGFIVIVLYLQLVQAEYNPTEQFMSELRWEGMVF